MENLIDYHKRMNSYLGERLVTVPREINLSDPEVLRKSGQWIYVLTPEEVLKFGVSRTAGNKGFDSYHDPRKCCVNSEELHKRPAFWFVSHPYFAGQELLMIVEKIIVGLGSSRLSVLGESKGLPVLLYDLNFKGRFSESWPLDKKEALVQRLSEVGMAPYN